MGGAMSKLRIYIAGPMTGYPEHNYPAFAAASERLRELGYEVVSPAEINAGLEMDGWAACMRRDLVQLTTCDTMYMLPGWENSRGARLEWQIAEALGMSVIAHAGAACPK